MKRVAIYTAIFGDRDSYREPPRGDYDCYLFTDKPVPTEHAIVRHSPMLIPGDPTRSARMYKLLPHVFLPDYELTLWMDGDFVLNDVDVLGMEREYLSKTHLATFTHRFRQCAYDEAKECLARRLDDPDVIARQMEFYRSAGYPEQIGLAETGIQLRRSQELSIKAFGAEWWREVLRGSRRDQLSFNFTAWRIGLAYSVFNGRVDNNPHFKLEAHQSKTILPA